jgi:type II secretory pathway pseudopilin PulG
MKIVANQCGFTYIFVLTVVMIMGIMLGMVGQSWHTIMQREREKELLFRGSQIKEAIENWHNLKSTVIDVNQPQVAQAYHPLMDLKDLLQDPNSPTKKRYLPQSYAAELDDTNPKCSPDCAKLKVYQDPMTGKEWTLLRGTVPDASGNPQVGGIIDITGVASKSDETPFRTDFKDTALEKLGVVPVDPKPKDGFDMGTPPPDSGDKKPKYSQWEFREEGANDHTKIYRAYHEGW